MEIPAQGIRLNIGCGRKIFDGYVNTDVAAAKEAPRPPELICPADKIPLPDGCAVEVLAIHLVEHLYPWDVPVAIAEWFRLLRPNGVMHLEMPDVLKAARNLVENTAAAKKNAHPDQLGMWGIFGDDRGRDPYMLHKSGWWFERLKPIVRDAGFVDIVERDTQFHSVGRGIRDFRLEARKP